VNVSIRKNTFGPGVGNNKKEAEQNAAEKALAALRKRRPHTGSVRGGQGMKNTGEGKRKRVVRSHKRPRSSGKNAQK
jgi:hypothetical protein